MKLYDYMKLVPDGEEISIYDKEYDMEVYFYGGESTGWNKLMFRFAKLLTINKITSYGVTVNLSDVIEKHMNQLKKADLFTEYDIEIIMLEMEKILSGNVSESWTRKFIECLSS